MKISKLILFTTFVFITNIVYSQNTFQTIIKDLVSLQDIIQNENNEYIVVGGKSQSIDAFGNYLIILSEIGEILEKKEDFKIDTITETLNILCLENNNLLTYSTLKQTDGIRNIIELVELSPTFDTIKQKKLYVDIDSDISFKSGIIKIDEGFLIYSGLFLYKIDNNLDSLCFTSNNSYVYQHAEYMGNGKLYVTGEGFENTTNMPGDIAQINLEDLSLVKAFNISDSVPINQFFFNVLDGYIPKLKRISDTTLLFTSGVDNDDTGERFHYHILIDTAFNIITYDITGDAGENRLITRKSIAYSKEKNIYTATQLNFVDNLCITKHSQELEFIWEKYYYLGNYLFNSMISTNDDGLLLIGEDVYTSEGIVIKTDTNGNITHINGEPSEQKAKEVILYPNPATSELTIQKAVQVGNCTVEFFSITGQKVLSQELTNNTTKIDISNLEKGSYIYKISNNSKTIDNGKWIKQ